MRIDVKKHLEGKGESNIPLQTGDLVVAQGNIGKTIGSIGANAGLESFITIIARGWYLASREWRQAAHQTISRLQAPARRHNQQ